jgi:ribosome-associated translation inhibitor RaiA
MKTITLTDEQFDTLYEYVDDKVTTIVDASVDYQDSEILNEWEDLLDVHTLLEEVKVKFEKKLAKAQAKQPIMEWD